MKAVPLEFENRPPLNAFLVRHALAEKSPCSLVESACSAVRGTLRFAAHSAPALAFATQSGHSPVRYRRRAKIPRFFVRVRHAFAPSSCTWD